MAAALTLTASGVLAVATQAQEAPLPTDPSIPADSQRIRILEDSGGPVTTALPLNDGTALIAEGDALLRANITGQTVTILSRQPLGYGTIIDLAQPTPTTVLALTEQAIVSLQLTRQDALPVVDVLEGGGQAFDVRSGVVTVAARSAGVRLIALSDDGSLQRLQTVSLGGEALDVAMDPVGGQVYVAASSMGVVPVQLESGAVGQQLSGIDQAQSVTFSGNILTVASGEKVYTVDVQRRNIIGTYAPLTNGRRIEIEEEYAYIADAAHGLKILWLTAIDRPVQTFGEVDQSLTTLTVEDGFVYGAGENTFRIYDARNRFRPLTLSSLPLSHTATDIAIGNGRAFVTLGDGGVAVIDITNLSQPRQLKRIPLDGPAEGVLFFEDRAYVASSAGSLTVISAGAFGQESITATAPLPAAGYDIGRRGDFLYIAAGELGLVAVNIINPSQPRLAGTLAAETNSAYTAMVIAGKRAYVSDGAGYLVADVSFPANMGRLARIDDPSQHIGVSGITLYSLNGATLNIFDIRATAEPMLLRQYGGINQIGRLTTQANRVFLSNPGAGPDGIILGLETPDSLFETDNFGSNGGTQQLIPAGFSLLVAQEQAGFTVRDLTDAGSTQVRSRYRVNVNLPLTDPDTIARRTVRSGSVTVAALGDAGIWIQNVDDAGFQVEPQATVNDVALDRRFIYAAQSDGLTIYDAGSGVALVSVPLPDAATGVALEGNQAYLSLNNGSIAVVDIGDPTSGLQPLGGIRTNTAASFARTERGQLFALTGQSIGRLAVSNPADIRIFSQERLGDPADVITTDGNVLYTYSEGDDARAYLANQIGDNATERARFFLGSAEMPGLFATDDFPPGLQLLVIDDVAFTSYGPEGLSSYIIGEAGNSQRLSEQPVYGLARSDELLFAVGSALTVYSVSEPAKPQRLASVPLADAGQNLFVVPSETDDITVFVGSAQGIRLFNWDGTTFRAISELSTESPVEKAIQIDERAYLALRAGGVAIVDVADPAEPTLLFTIVSSYGRFANDLLAVDAQTLLISWEGGIEAYQTGQASNVPQLVRVIPEVGERTTSISVESTTGRIAAGLTGGQVAVIAQAEDGMPSIRYATTPGSVQHVGLQGDILYVANGGCGLRVFDASQPELIEVAYWHGGFASDVNPLPEGGIDLTIDDQQMIVLYDPLLPANPPETPQIPRPAAGAFDIDLSPQLAWGSPTTPCDNHRYDVYFGTAPEPVQYADRITDAALTVGPLRPGTTYYWQVAVTDRQGDRVEGDVWRFETQTSRLPSPLPPSPPPFLQRLIENAALPIALTTLFLICMVGAYSYWRWRRRKANRR